MTPNYQKKSLTEALRQIHKLSKRAFFSLKDDTKRSIATIMVGAVWILIGFMLSPIAYQQQNLASSSIKNR